MTRETKYKTCARCGKTKTLRTETFAYATVNGRRRWRLCRLCERERQREQRARATADPVVREHRRVMKNAAQNRRYAADPERGRRASREWKERLKAEDPERYVELILVPRRFRKEGRDYSKIHRETNDGYTPPSWHEGLPAAPLADYLRRTFPGWEPAELLAYTRHALTDKALRRLLTEPDARIMLATADRLLTYGLGRPDLLDALYPSEGRQL